MGKLLRLLRHRWVDDSDLRRSLPTDALARITASVAASELRHSGEIRVCVEAGLPLSYLWRGLSARDRAGALFGKLGVWDPAHNTGVLLYLLLAERAIEVVADRGLNAHVNPAQWQAIVNGLSQALRSGQPEAGLLAAVAAVNGLLAQHFALDPSGGGGGDNPNELPDAPLLL